MSEDRELTDGKMDRLLRNWGAEEAVRQARVDYLRPPVRRVAPAPSLWQWLPLATSLVLVGGAGALLFLTRTAASSSAAEVERLREEIKSAERKWKSAAEALSELRADRDRLADSAAESHKLLVVAQEELRAKASELADQAARLAVVTEQVREMMRTLAETDTALKAAREQLNLREQEITELRRKAENAGRAQEEVSRLRAQVVQQNESISAATADKENLASRVSALQAERDVMRTMLHRLYIAAAGAGATGTPALQTVMRHNRLIERFAEFRSTIRSPEVRKLADQVEIALTRLALLTPTRLSDVDSMASFVAQTNLCARINDVLAAAEEPAMVRSWLLEAQLMLAEINNNNEGP